MYTDEMKSNREVLEETGNDTIKLNEEFSSKRLDDEDHEVKSVTNEENIVIYPDIDILTTIHPGQEFICKKTRKSIEARVQGPPCGCPRDCRERLNNAHEEIYNNFRNLESYEQQNWYLYDCIDVGEKKKCYKSKTKNPQSRRTVTANYSVVIDGVNISVCKVEFMNLHGLQNSIYRLDRIIKMKKEAIFPKTDGRDKHTNRSNRLKMKEEKTLEES